MEVNKMAKKINIIVFFIMTLLLLSPCASFAGGGGGKGGGDDSGGSGPQYYSYEDLRNALKQRVFDFANNNRPSETLVALGYYPYYCATCGSTNKLTSLANSNPTGMGVNNLTISANWNDNIETTFDWNKFYTANGSDPCTLIFLRGNGKGADIVKIFSEWTHVAIVDDPRNCMVFESNPDTNVKINCAKTSWKNITYYTCKKIKMANNPVNPVTIGQLTMALHDAENRYNNTPYFPQVQTIFDLLGGFVLRWCNKDDQSSMYCSKLVYNTFKGLVDFDTKLTGVDSNIIGDSSRPIASGFFGWFGISPDDIYYSPSLAYDFCYSQNVLKL
jgi:hypothetical protein